MEEMDYMARAHTHTHTHIHHAHTHVRTHTHTHTHTHTNTHTHTHIHTHTHAHTQKNVELHGCDKLHGVLLSLRLSVRRRLQWCWYPVSPNVSATWLFHTWDLTRPYVRHDSLRLGMLPSSMVLITRFLLCECDMTHSCVKHDSFLCETWLIAFGNATVFDADTSFPSMWVRHDSYKSSWSIT